MSLELLPDCRTRHATGAVRGRGDDGIERNFVPVYCGNCGAPDGYVTETAASIFVLCDGCTSKHGVPAGCLPCGPEVWQERIAEATRDLSEVAILTALDVPTSSMSKLAADYQRALRGST